MPKLLLRFCCILCVLSCLSCESLPPEVPKAGIVQLDPALAREISDSITAVTPVQLADGLTLTLWASDSLLQDPVALYMDPQGRAFVTSTSRGNNSEFDIRGHQDWMTQSISWQQLAERKQFLHNTLSTESPEKNDWFPDLNGDSVSNWLDLTVEKEKVIRIEDTDGDGIADFSHTFVEGFHEEYTDVAGGFTGHNGDYFLGVAPDLWRLSDANQDGTVDEMTSIVHGFQVHIGFGGHGMSGVKVGPDGKIYWGIGDIGFNVTDQTGKNWFYPNQGGIFRANPDGSDFEVFAAGLRNTHEFDWDAYGNLISVDNDGDYPNEQERLVYIVNGSDAGWRSNWQYGKYTDPDNNRYNVWIDENMYKPRFEGQAAHIIPPIQNYHAGPTGLKYQPGTALGGKYPNHFFVVEFPGAASRAKLHAFELEANGAGFQMKQEQIIAQGVLATGLDIGADGSLYFSDWITGWSPKDYGRIWKLSNEEFEGAALQQEVETMLQEDLSDLDREELFARLGHIDKRIRQYAQFELASRGLAVSEELLEIARSSPNEFARIHALWAVAQLVRNAEAKPIVLTEFLSDTDPEIRAQAARLIGDIRFGDAGDQLVELLKDQSSRVRFFAAEAIARTAYAPAIPAIIRMLEDNNDEDVYLRFVGANALASTGKPEPIIELASHEQVALRIAAVVALRRMKHPGVAEFLGDENEWVVTEVARAIHDDFSIPEALPALAEYLDRDKPFQNEPLMRRVLSANSRLGRPADLQRLIRFAVESKTSDVLRAEALSVITVWENPSVLDRVDGRYRGPDKRDRTPVVMAMLPHVPTLLGESPLAVKLGTVQMVGKLGMTEYAVKLLELIQQDRELRMRSAAIIAVSEMESDSVGDAIKFGLLDQEPEVRQVALSLIPDLPMSDKEKVFLLSIPIKEGTRTEKQTALATLASIPGEDADGVLSFFLARWEEGRFSAEFQLELAEAIHSSSNQSLKDRLTAIQPDEDADPLTQYADLLDGGNARSGRNVFWQNSSAQCARCHSMGNNGAKVGPDLAGVGNRLSRESLLLSLIAPSEELALGYGVAVLKMKNGETASGILVKETATEYHLQTNRVEPVRYAKGNVTSIQMAPSAMPNMSLILSRREIRDLVAYLAGLE